MEARFFNAKTGRVNRFINPPVVIVVPPKINVLSNNHDWRSSELLIINPKNNNGNYRFRVEANVGANTINTITLTEYIIKS